MTDEKSEIRADAPRKFQAFVVCGLLRTKAVIQQALMLKEHENDDSKKFLALIDN